MREFSAVKSLTVIRKVVLVGFLICFCCVYCRNYICGENTMLRRK